MRKSYSWYENTSEMALMPLNTHWNIKIWLYSNEYIGSVWSTVMWCHHVVRYRWTTWHLITTIYKKYCHMTLHSLLLQVNAVLCVSIHISLLHTRWKILKKWTIKWPKYKITGYYQNLQLKLTYSRVKKHISISSTQSPL